MMFAIESAALVFHLLTWISATASPAAVFPVFGNVYPQGQYHTTIKIGDSNREFDVDIDTGSDLTWLQCNITDAKNTPTINPLYVPVENASGSFSQVDPCMHTICLSLQRDEVPNCGEFDMSCHYQIDYADSGSSLGLLVFDNLHLDLSDGTNQTALVSIGCGYDQEFHGTAPVIDGILGLGRGQAGILSQLQSDRVMDNIVAHCFGAEGGGYLSFGGVPSFNPIVWKSVSNERDYYAMGSAEIWSADKQDNPVLVSTGLQVIFDSGSTYSYFSSQAYQDLLKQIKADLVGANLTFATDDNTLPVCWKAPQPFTHINEAVFYYFEPFHLILTDNGQNTTFQMSPESYLILTEKGNVCLGILDGGGVGIGNEHSLIGDISMQNKWIIYDNEKSQVGWVNDADCRVKPQF